MLNKFLRDNLIARSDRYPDDELHYLLIDFRILYPNSACVFVTIICIPTSFFLLQRTRENESDRQKIGPLYFAGDDANGEKPLF